MYSNQLGTGASQRFDRIMDAKEDAAKGSFMPPPNAHFGAGAIGPMSVNQIEESPLRLAISNLQGLHNVAVEIHYGLISMADRVGGPIPTGAASASGEKVGEQSHMDSLHAVVSRLNSTLDGIAAEVSRLNRLVG